MVSRKWQQHTIDQHDMLEVVNDAFSVEKVHGGAQEIPVQSLGKAQGAGSAGNVGNGDDFLERDDLDRRDNEDDVDVASEHGSKEDANHGKCPDGARDEGLFLLFILGHFLRRLRRNKLVSQKGRTCGFQDISPFHPHSPSPNHSLSCLPVPFSSVSRVVSEFRCV